MKKIGFAIIIALALAIFVGVGIRAGSDKNGSLEADNAVHTEASDPAGAEPSGENPEILETSETPYTDDAKEQEITSGQDNTEESGNISEKESLQEEEMSSPEEDSAGDEDNAGSILRDASELNFTDVDGRGINYTFTYAGEEFRAVYSSNENWKVYDSYRINSEADLLIICQALIDEHPIHGRDMVSFRTAEDMVYEWQIHNMAYAFLKDDDPLKDDARDVDLDPKDQGLSIEELYKSRTGKDLDLREH